MRKGQDVYQKGETEDEDEEVGENKENEDEKEEGKNEEKENDDGEENDENEANEEEQSHGQRLPLIGQRPIGDNEHYKEDRKGLKGGLRVEAIGRNFHTAETKGL